MRPRPGPPGGGWRFPELLGPDPARPPEVVEALRILLKKVPQIEIGAVRTVPFLQLLERRVPGERGHGGTGELHGAGRARKRKKQQQQRAASSASVRAAVFMAQASGPAPPGPASGRFGPAPPLSSAPATRPCQWLQIWGPLLALSVILVWPFAMSLA